VARAGEPRSEIRRVSGLRADPVLSAAQVRQDEGEDAECDHDDDECVDDPLLAD
jgi:hypothetical protein